MECMSSILNLQTEENETKTTRNAIIKERSDSLCIWPEDALFQSKNQQTLTQGKGKLQQANVKVIARIRPLNKMEIVTVLY